MHLPLPRPGRLAGLLAVGLGGALAVGGCGLTPTGSQHPHGRPVAEISGGTSAHGYAGLVLDRPVAKPAMTLTGPGGRPFAIRRDTAGHVTFLYFGYTHCEDECPTQMADLATALRAKPAAAADVRVLFVTTDPARDTPARMRAWLDRFDRGLPAFVGLTGTPTQLVALQRAAGVEVAVEEKAPDGQVRIGHSTQMLAFGHDGRASVVYMAGSSSADIAHDLPLIEKGT